MPTAENAAAIARIDAHRARKLGEMLVTAPAEFQEPEATLFDLGKCDAAQLLATYHRTRGSFATSPFDPGARLKFYDRGYSIWSGYPGAGKTTALRQLVCHLLHSGRKVFVASLEDHPIDVIVHLAGVAFGCEVPTVKQLQWFIDWYQGSLRIWAITGTSSHTQLLGTAQHLAKQEGVTQVIIDNLDCLDIDAKDIELQRQFARRVNALTIESGLHLHLVAHPRKSLSTQQDSDLNDIAGAASLGRLAHNILFVKRQKPESNTQVQELGGMRIAVRKQRYGSGFIGDIDGWLNRRLRQFKTDNFDQVPTQYLPKEAYEEGP